MLKLADKKILSKTITYRIIRIITNIIIIYLVTGDITLATPLGIGLEVIATITYYTYEKVCAKKRK